MKNMMPIQGQQGLTDFQQLQQQRNWEIRSTVNKPQLRALRSQYTQSLKELRKDNSPEANLLKKSIRTARRSVNQMITPSRWKRWPKNLIRWSGKWLWEASQLSAKNGWKAGKWSARQAGKGVRTAFQKGKGAYVNYRQSVADKRASQQLQAKAREQDRVSKLLPDPTAPAKSTDHEQARSSGQSNTRDVSLALDRGLSMRTNRQLRPDSPGQHLRMS